MKVHIRRKLSLNNIAFYFVLCLALLSGYFGGASVGFPWASPLWNAGIVTMFSIVLMDYVGKKKMNTGTINVLLVGGIIFIAFIAVSYFLGADRGYARRNLMTIVKVIVVEISIMMLVRNPRFDFYGKMKSAFWIFNIWGFLNMLVLSLQVNIKGFMMPLQWLSMNRYYEDLCAGLFGYNGTHRLGLYMTFLFLYNLYIAEFETPQKRKRKKLYIYNFVLLVWHFILSTQNDNMTIYILTALFFISYIFMDLHWRNHSLLVNMSKWGKYILIGFLTVLLFFTIPSTREFVIDGVIERIMKLTTVTASTGSGSTERLSIILYSFENGFGCGLGRGIGYWPIGGDFEANSSVGFRHFGLSSMSSIIYLMGLWFYIFFLIWVSKIYQSLCKKNDILCFVVIFLIMFFLTFYTTNLTSTPMTVCLMLLFSIFGMMQERLNDKNIIG